MTRTRLASTLAIALLVVGSACGSSGDDRSETFRSPTYGYTIAHPSNWSAVAAVRELPPGGPPYTSGGGTDILGEHADPKVSRMVLPGLVIGAQKVREGTSIEHWRDNVIGVVSMQKACRSPSATERVRVGGRDAVLLTYPDCPAGSGLFHYWIAVVNNGRGFHIVWFDNTGREARDRRALDELLTSMSFAG